MIVRDTLVGKRYCKDFSQSPEKIATNVLADRLGELVESGIVEKWVPGADLGREAYRLATKRKSLKSVFESVAK